MATSKDGINGTLGNELSVFCSFDGNYLDSSGNSVVLTKNGSLSLSTDKDGTLERAYISQYDTDSCFTHANPIGTLASGTVSFWLKVNTSEPVDPTRRWIYMFSDVAFGLMLNPSYELSVYKGAYSTIFGSLNDGWNHIVIRFISLSSIAVHINDAINTLSVNSSDHVSSTLTLGSGFSSPALTLGYDEYRVYTRAITESEVSELYEMGVNYIALTHIDITKKHSTFNSITLDWSDIEGVATYDISYKKTSDIEYEIITNVTGNTTVLYGLVSNDYDIVVKGYDNNLALTSEGVAVFSTQPLPIIGSEKITVKKLNNAILVKLELPYTYGTPNQSIIVRYRKHGDSAFTWLKPRMVKPKDTIYIYGLDMNYAYDVEIEY